MTGHLFVVHGKIEHLVHDAAIVSVDRVLDFNPIWKPLLGEPWPAAPDTWTDGWGRIDGRDQWLVEVGDGDYDRVLKRLTSTLDDIRAAGLGARFGRELPLVALPVLGVGLGGHAHEPGTVVRTLVGHLESEAARLGLDIALVTPDPSVYAAAQFMRRQSVSQPAIEQVAAALGERARRGELALLLGAGVSIPAGLKSWGELIEHLAAGVSGLDAEHLAELSPTDQAELIELADPKGFQKRVADLASGAERPSLLHALLAGLDVAQVVTTNYDVLYEDAVAATGRRIESVMPWASALGADRWVLKLHGDIKHKKKIVLTRRHMVRYDASNRPSAALLQSLLLTKHLLVVGASLTDDNVIRLAHEVQAYRDEHQKKRLHQPFGTVLDASRNGDRARGRLWDGQLKWHHLAAMDEKECPTRTLELLLDRVGVHASHDSSWLLDPRFDGLLGTDEDRDIAARARELFGLLGRDDHWEPLRTSLSRLGAAAGVLP